MSKKTDHYEIVIRKIKKPKSLSGKWLVSVFTDVDGHRMVMERTADTVDQSTRKVDEMICKFRE